MALEITQRCNLDCTLCYLSENSEAVHDRPIEEVFRRIELIHRHYGRNTDVQITGGDPTLRMGLSEIARRIRCAVSSVHRWAQDWKKNGNTALASKPVPGRPQKLTARQQDQLLRLLLQGAMANGFPNELWTLKRIASLIRKEFGVPYHPSHLWRVLQSCGWSCQVPERCAIQRDEQAIAHWKRHQWPALKKSSKTWRPHRISR